MDCEFLVEEIEEADESIGNQSISSSIDLDGKNAKKKNKRTF